MLDKIRNIAMTAIALLMSVMSGVFILISVIRYYTLAHFVVLLLQVIPIGINVFCLIKNATLTVSHDESQAEDKTEGKMIILQAIGGCSIVVSMTLVLIDVFLI